MIHTVINRLLLVCGITALAGTAFIVLWSDGATFAERFRSVGEVVEQTFAHGPWGIVGRASIVSIGVAAGLTALDSVVNRRRQDRAEGFRDLGKGNVRQHVQEVARRVEQCLTRDRGGVVQAFDELVRGAIAIEASDIHMSPTPGGFRLTYRVHGMLYEIASLDLSLSPRLATRVKVLARLDTYIRGTPQDGRLVMTIDGTMVEARVSTLPTETGERVVLRFVRGSRSVPDVDSLGFSEAVVREVKALLARPQGIFFMTAPVGSGKTTTLYAAMKHIAETRGRMTTLVTLEDPIELELPFATQTQMHPRAGMTFASTLRSVLRQDPNVLMVGEIRDQETADIVMQAGLTGHLILTTVHGDTAAGPFARIIDMKVEPFVIASATIGCVSQRLVRTLCTACRREAEPEPLIVERFEKLGVELPSARYFEAKGCDYCENTGFTGRRPIAEVLVVDAAVRSAIHECRPTRELYQLAVDRGMRPLLLDGLDRAAEGETSLAEILRVAG